MGDGRVCSSSVLRGDQVLVEGLAVECIIGVFAWEREVPQRLVLDVAMAWDNRLPGRTDQVTDALNYADVAAVVTRVLEAGRFQLLEAAAEACASALHAELGVMALRLVIRKPGAVTAAESVGVIIEREWPLCPASI